MVQQGGQIACTWYDSDTDFSVLPRQAWLSGPAQFAQPNQSVPTPMPPSVPGGPMVYVPGQQTRNYPVSGQPPVVIHYWVQAQFADGSTSPLRGPLTVPLQ